MAEPLTLTALVWGRGKKYTALCPQLDLQILGETPERALGLLTEIIQARARYNPDFPYDLHVTSEHQIRIDPTGKDNA